MVHIPKVGAVKLKRLQGMLMKGYVNNSQLKPYSISHTTIEVQMPQVECFAV